MQDILEAELLATFVAIAEAHSFTEAGVRVGRTQSAVSMQMKRLEELVGRPLFERGGRQIVLTREGEVLLGHARRILKAHGQALAAVREPELAGTVALGSPDDYASTFMPPILARFARTHPQVHVELVCDSSDELARLVAKGKVDLSLVTSFSGEDNVVAIFRERLVWVASASHCAYEEDPLPLALYHPGCIFRHHALSALSHAGRSSRIAYSSISLAGIEAAVRAGLAVSVLGRTSIRDGMRELTAAEGFPPLPDYQIGLVRAPGRSSPLTDRLEQYVRESFERDFIPRSAA